MKTAFEHAMATRDVGEATSILRTAGLAEAGSILVELPGPQTISRGLPVGAYPLWHCGFYYKVITLPDGREESGLGFRCGWN